MPLNITVVLTLKTKCLSFIRYKTIKTLKINYLFIYFPINIKLSRNKLCIDVIIVYEQLMA